MITLNTEKGLVRIDSWEGVLSRPGFTVDIDPNSVELKEIIGSYKFKDFIKCGLSTCHQPHGRGYLVVTKDGRETNIGKDCGKTHFSVDFEGMRRAYDREIKNKDRRERLTALKHQIPMISQRIEELKKTEYGANWVHKNVAALLEPGKGLPREVLAKVAALRRSRDGSLMVQRLATKEERDLAEASGQRRSGDHAMYLEERAGFIQGVPALYEENNLRSIVIEKIEAGLERLAAVDIDQLGDRQLAEMNKWATELEPAIKKAEEAVWLGRQLLTKENLGQLSQFITDKEAKSNYSSFISKLPSSGTKT
ncbi:hypothetical protein [Wenzhouxiangella sp. EGI_FJ10305]|uniref:hypothetical protein n=1 Tax=Wenzhouxiangella sp. EGI_FJ10305 TaxID=3243768 RepID=UPI0035E2BF88